MKLQIFLFLLLIILYCVTHLKKFKNNDLLFLRIFFVILFIVVGSRQFYVGTDTPMYLSLFEKCSQYKWHIFGMTSYFEKGYLFINIILSYLFTNKSIFLYLFSFIFNFSIYKFIKNNSNNYFLSSFMYIGLLYVYLSMTMYRQFCALILVLLAYKYLKKEKIIPFLLFVFMATLFHSTAWIGLLLLAAKKLKLNYKSIIILSIAAIISYIYIGSVANFVTNLIGRTNYYTNRIGSNNMANILYTFVYFSMFLFSYFSTKRKKEENKESQVYINIMFFATLVNFIAINMDIFSRASIYFNIFSIIAVPNILVLNYKKVFNRRVISFVLCLALLLYSTIIIKFRPEWNTAFDYKSCIIEKDNNQC